MAKGASMWAQTLVVTTVVLSVSYSAALLGQEKPATSAPSGAQEFPVILQESVAAGKTPVGTKIQAKLAVATLVAGTVIPRNAVFSGEVVESVAKTKTDPSRLSIRMDSVQWKTNSIPVKVYSTAWYYPLRDAAGQELQYGPQEPANRTWNGQGQYPDPNSKVYRPFPGGDPNQGTSVPDTPSATISNHRVLMKDVETASSNDGTLTLVSKRTNIKLDKLTTYVLASADLLSAK
jgi:hypothetical protein